MNAQILRLAMPPEEHQAAQSLTSLLDLRNSDCITCALEDSTPPANPVAARSREILKEALQIFHQLEDGTPLVRVATTAKEVHALGIGQLLSNGHRKGLIDADLSPANILNQVFNAETMRIQDRPISRYRFIIHLKALGIVAQRQNERQLKPAGTTPCMKALAALIFENTQISMDQIASESRVKKIVIARFKLIWLMRSVCGHSLTMIGQNLGNRDHTTILNSINKVKNECASDAGYSRSIHILCEKADTIGILQNRNLLLRASKHLH